MDRTHKITDSMLGLLVLFPGLEEVGLLCHRQRIRRLGLELDSLTRDSLVMCQWKLTYW
jgi:hypothetical protein